MTVTINGTTGIVAPAFDGAVDAADLTGTVPSSAVPYVSGRNRIINGNMVIDQRNNGASVTGSYAVDRFEFQENSGSGYTVQRSSVAPSGFSNSLLITVTTAASASAGQTNRLIQRVEGHNIADLNFGSANASTVTLSFWVRSSLVGTYCAALVNNAANRAYVAEYSISAANTWEYKTITVAGDTTGTWETGTASGVQVTFDFGSGSDFNATAGSWVAANDWRTTNQVNFANTSGATFYITGVQLEAGSIATPFERRLYVQELALCQRYYYIRPRNDFESARHHGFDVGTNRDKKQRFHPVTMRAAPSVTFTSSTAIRDDGVGITATFVASVDASNIGVHINTSPTQYGAGTVHSIGYGYTADAEL